MKKSFQAFFIAGILAVSAHAYGEETRFFSELTDVPLMPGLYEVSKDTAVFDKPEGRIVESSAASETQKPDQIADFYAVTLPQLGWEAEPHPGAKEAVYHREGEMLTVRVSQEGAVSLAHFSLAPASP